MRFVSLKTKTALLAAVVTFLTTGLLGGYLVWSSYRALRAEVQRSRLALARTLAWEVDEGLSNAMQTIAAFARDPRALSLGPRELAREMTLMTSTTEFVDTLLWFRKDGSLLAKSISNTPTADFPPAGYIRQTLDRSSRPQRSVLVDAYTALSGNLEIAISAPVLGPRGSAGVLVGVMHLPNHVIGNLDTARIGRSGYAYMVNQDGIAILHPDRAKWLRDLSDNPAVQAFQARKEGWIQFQGPEGEEVVAAFAPVKTSGWGVIVRQPASECYEPATRMLWQTTFFVAAAMAVSVLLSVFLAGKFVDPIMALSREVEGFRTWESFPGMPGVSSPDDEVGVLGQALFRMMGTIQAQSIEKEKAHFRTLRAERKAAESERLATVGQWSAGLAHEMNNPLTIILGAVQMAARSGKKGTRRWLREIGKEAERCRRLLVDLLQAAKPMKIRVRTCDLGLLARETWERLPDVGTAYELSCEPGSFKARIDPDRFTQVFLNLLKNSREAMPKGGKVRVEFRTQKGMNRVALTDQGPGIRSRDLQNLFKPFFTTKAQGTGLGLAMVQAILREHGGTVSAKNQRSGGLKMVMEWPVKIPLSKGRA